LGRRGIGLALGRGAGLLCRLLLGCGGPIGKPLFFLIFFSVFFFSFLVLLILNSNLNFVIFAGFSIRLILSRVSAMIITPLSYLKKVFCI
jgi:hypothetical protein